MRLGMNVDEVESATRELNDAAVGLMQCRSAVDALVFRLNACWSGHDSSRLIERSWPNLREQIRQASDDVQRMARTLADNATEQRQASSAGNSRLETGLAGLQKLGSHADGVGQTITILNGIKHNGYNETWKAAQESFTKGDMFKFRKSTTIKLVEDLVRNPSPLAPILENAEKFKVAERLGYLGIAAQGIDTFQTFSRGDVAGGATKSADMFASALKITPKSPVTYLVGVNISVWSHVIDEGRKVDWSSKGWHDITHASARDWAGALAETERKAPGLLMDVLF